MSDNADDYVLLECVLFEIAWGEVTHIIDESYISWHFCFYGFICQKLSLACFGKWIRSRKWDSLSSCSRCREIDTLWHLHKSGGISFEEERLLWRPCEGSGKELACSVDMRNECLQPVPISALMVVMFSPSGGRTLSFRTWWNDGRLVGRVDG